MLGFLKSRAQLNESDTIKFQTRISLTGISQKGNVEFLNIRSKWDFTFALQKKWVFKSQNNSLYQEFYNKKADNDFFSRNYLYFKPYNKIYPFAIAYISSNFRRKIDKRTFAGVSITWQAIQSKNSFLKFSVSGMYENTRFTINEYNYSAYNGNDQIKVWRGTLYMSGQSFIAERHIRIFYDAYWQPAIKNGNNYRTQFDFGADFAIWKGLSFTFLYDYSHENVVVNQVKQNDKILTFGLSYSYKLNHQ